MGFSKKNKELLILMALILLKFTMQQFLIDPIYELHRDEFLYLDQANHIAMGYSSVPPLTSWISYIIYLLGNSVFWIKFFPALFGALTIVIVWKTVKELNGAMYAKILASTCVLFSSLLRLNTLYQPNSFDVLAWTMTFFYFIKYVNSNEKKWIYCAAISFGIGFLNKYNIVFLALGLIMALLISNSRSLFLKREILISIGIVLLIIAPNVLWQYNNGFPVINHMQELADTQLVNVQRMSFLKNQFFFFLGAVFVIPFALYGLLFSTQLKKFHFLFWSFIFTLTLFTYLKAKDYYAIGLYPIYIAIGSVYISRIMNHKVGYIIKPILLIMPVLATFLSFDIAFPNKRPEYIIKHQDTYRDLGLLRWEDGKDHEIPQDYADMLGWKELASKVKLAMQKIDSPESTLVLCDNYGQAGAINFYSNGAIKAVSFDADYLNWFDLRIQYTNLIRVKNRDERGTEFIETSPYFESSSIMDSITNKYSREFGTTIFIFEGSKVDINKRIQEELHEKNNEN